MAPSHSSGGNRPMPAQVVHFPKAAKPRSRSGEHLRRDASQPRTDPEGRLPFDEPVTEPEFFVPTSLEPAGSPSPADRPIWIDARDHQRSLPARVRAARAKAGRSRKRARPPTTSEVSEQSRRGHQLFERGHLDEARAVFERLVDAGVEDAYVHTMLGTICLALDDQDRALALFEAALALSSGDIAARVYRGEIRLNRGKLHLALDDLQLAVKLGEPDDPFVDRARRLIEIARELGAGSARR